MEIGGEDVEKVKGGEGGQERKDVVLTERASKAYTGATYENQSGPRQTQSSDLARLTEWCWTNFFHVSSELARPISLGAWHLAPSTVQQRVTGPALLRRWGQGPGCGGRAQTEPTEHSSSPRSALGLGNRGGHCLGLSSCYPPRRVIVQSRRAKKRHLLSTLVGRVSPFQSQSLLCMQTSGPDTAKRSPIPPFQDLQKGPGKSTMHRLMLTRYPFIKQVSQNTQHFYGLQHLLFDFCPCVTRALHDYIICSSGSRS